MRRIVSVITVLLLCGAMVCNVFADTFVPSISYKDAPGLEEAAQGGEDVSDCLVVTSINEANDKSTDISQEDRDLLLDVYDQLSDGSMKLPVEEDYVIRDLVDVSYSSSCIEAGHGHKEALAEDGVTVTVTFDLGVSASTDVVVMAYVDGAWVKVDSVENNGDGTVTCVFEDLCPVAFCVEDGSEPPYTGDNADRQLLLWVVVMVVSLGAIVTLLYQRRRTAR